MSDEPQPVPFTFKWPLWIVARKDSVDWDEVASGYSMLSSLVPVMYGANTDGKKCALLFTDDNLAERFAARDEDYAATSLRKNSAIWLFKHFQRDGTFDHVLIDAKEDGSRSGILCSIEEFLKSTKTSEPPLTGH